MRPRQRRQLGQRQLLSLGARDQGVQRRGVYPGVARDFEMRDLEWRTGRQCAVRGLLDGQAAVVGGRSGRRCGLRLLQDGARAGCRAAAERPTQEAPDIIRALRPTVVRVTFEE